MAKPKRPVLRASGKYEAALALPPSSSIGHQAKLRTSPLGDLRNHEVLDQGYSEVSWASRQDRGPREGEGVPDLMQAKLDERADGVQGRGWDRSTVRLWLGSSDWAEDASRGCCGREGGQQSATARSLMVQDVGDIKSLKILHLQDPVKVLQPLVIVGHVGRQVAVDDADIIAIQLQADVDAPFVPLGGQVGRRVEAAVGGKYLFSHPRPEGRWSLLPQDLPGHSASQGELSIRRAQLTQPEASEAGEVGRALDWKGCRFILPFFPFAQL